MPASSGSPLLRARAKRTSSDCLFDAGKPTFRLKVSVTLPAASVAASAGVGGVAGEMAWQSFPWWRQPTPWSWNRTGGVPSRAPGVAAGAPPALASPVMVGGVVLTGPEAAAAATLAVAGLCAELEPSELE